MYRSVRKALGTPPSFSLYLSLCTLTWGQVGYCSCMSLIYRYIGYIYIYIYMGYSVLYTVGACRYVRTESLPVLTIK